jgi:hypothetical protein
VTSSGADGRSSSAALTSEGNRGPARFSLGWWCGRRKAEHDSRWWSGERKMAARKMSLSASMAGDLGSRSAATEQEWVVVFWVGSIEEEGARWWCSSVN